MGRTVAVALLWLAGGCLGANPDWDGDADEDTGASSGSTTTAASTDGPTTSAGTSTTTAATLSTTSTTTTTEDTEDDTGSETEGGSTGGFPQGRISDGLAVSHSFAGGSGTMVVDTSGLDPPLDMQISGRAAWSAQGLSINGDAILTTVDVPAMRIASDEFTVELWVDSQSTVPGLNDGPRIVAFEDHALVLTNFFVSGGAGLIGLTVPADGTGEVDDFVMDVEPGMRHVVFTVDPLGGVAGYENGAQELFGSTASLNPTLWMDDLPFIMANASDMGHPWQGDIGLIAIYDRALSAAEVQHNFEQGY